MQGSKVSKQCSISMQIIIIIGEALRSRAQRLAMNQHGGNIEWCWGKATCRVSMQGECHASMHNAQQACQIGQAVCRMYQ